MSDKPQTSQSIKNKGWLYISLRFKMGIAFTLLFTLIFAGAFYWFYTFATNTAMERIESDMIGTLNGVVEGIDPESFEELVADEEEGEAFEEHLAWIETVYGIEPRAVVYTYVPGRAPDEIRFVGDALRFIRPDDAAAFLEPYTSSRGADGPLLTGLRQQTTELEIYTDQWGSWVSAYAPIVDNNGDSVGAVGLDFRAEYVREVQQAILNNIFLAFAITYGVLFVTVYFITGSITQPIQALTRAAERIGEGDYNQNLDDITKDRFPDETDTLANVFEIMLEKVREREEKLKKRVAQLEIRLDEGKKDAQVNEIVETDFFRELQQKAKKVRDRSAPDSTTTSLIDDDDTPSADESSDVSETEESSEPQ